MHKLYLGRGPRWQLGLTLIELMIAIAILSILLAVGAPSMLETLREARLAAQSDLLVASLNTARMEAVKRRSDIKLCAANASGIACADSTSWSNGALMMKDSTVLQQVAIPAGVTLTTKSEKGVTFNGTLGSAGAVNFELCIPKSKTHTVQVQSSGHVNKKIASAVSGTCS